MKKNIDELLNNYIDNQLTNEELEEVKNLLATDHQAMNKLNALRLVHNSLQKLETIPAPVGFTEHFMKVLKTAPIESRHNNYFFYSVVGFFGILIVGITVFVFSSINYNFQSMDLSGYIEPVKSEIEKNSTKVLSVFKNKTVLMISSSMVLLLLILAYFGFESHKNLKKKINSFSH